jgi:hypothetical protein
MGGKYYQITGNVRGEEPSEREESNDIDSASRCTQERHQQPVDLS